MVDTIYCAACQDLPLGKIAKHEISRSAALGVAPAPLYAVGLPTAVSMNTIQRAPAQSAVFRFEELDDESLIFNTVTKRTVYLNPSATVIWKLCDGQRTIEEIAKLLKDAYPEASEDFLVDVESAVQALLSEGALRWVVPQRDSEANI